MNYLQFRNQYLNKKVDFDGWYGAQCVDLVQFYNRDVAGGKFIGGANAKDMYGFQPEKYNWVRNTPSGVPPQGAVIVYDKSRGGGYGHIAIVDSANTSVVNILSQNMPYGSGSILVQTNYSGVIGWGIPKNQVATPTPAPSNPGGTAQATSVANVRSQPHTGAPLAGSQKLQPGQTFQYSAIVDGQNVSGNNKWYRSTKGNYIWSGNVKKI